MKFQPLADRVVLRRIEQEPTGRIVIPDNAKEKSYLCEVVAVGPGAWIEGINGGLVRRPVEVKVGQKVLIGPYSDMELEGENLVICNEMDIRGIVLGGKVEQISRCA